MSLSLAFILYEGGLSLRLAEFRKVDGTVLKLILIGVPVTWFIAMVGARLILGLSWTIAFLLSAILVVTGPTVIGPLLQQVRPKSDVRSALKWESIFIDPVGRCWPCLLEFTYRDFQARHNGTAVPLFLVGVDDTLRVYTADNPPTPQVGQMLISLVYPVDSGATNGNQN